VRALYVCADAGIPLDGTKGASVHVRQTIGALIGAGVEVEVLAARPGSGWKSPCRVLSGTAPNPSPRSSRKSGSRRWNPSTLIVEAEALAASRDLIGAVDQSCDFDVVYERYSLWSLAGAALSEMLGAPLVLEVNAPLVEEQQVHRRCALGGVAAEIERAVLRHAARVLCVSPPLVERAAGLRGSTEGVELFPNAVDTDLFKPVERGGGDGDRPVTVVFTGSFKPWHGLAVLLRGFASACDDTPAARLVLAGDGPERAKMQALASELGIAPKVGFIGAMEHGRIPALLGEADIAVAPYDPSGSFYFSPLKIAEYLASGLAVVASSCADLNGLLRDGRSALLVPQGDAAALGRAIARLAGDPALRSHLGSEGRRVAVERLSLEAAAARLVNLLKDLSGSRASGALAGESSRVEQGAS